MESEGRRTCRAKLGRCLDRVRKCRRWILTTHDAGVRKAAASALLRTASLCLGAAIGVLAEEAGEGGSNG